MVSTIKLIFLIILLWSPLSAFANIFDPPATDLSVEYLGMIFGGNVGSINLGVGTLNNPFFGQLFQVLNGIILAVATFILTYVGTISIIHTAHEGEIMGKKWSSIWIPLRTAAGLLLMAPVPGSGYSLLQVTVMWIIINGIGAADKIWNLIVDNLAQGISPGQVQALDSAGINQLKGLAQSLGPGILNSLICLKVVENNVDNNFLQSVGQSLGVNFVDDPNSSNSGNVFFGLLDPSNPNNSDQAICGKIKISAGISQGELDPAVTKDQITIANSSAYQTKKETLSSMITYIKPIADTIVNNIDDLKKNNKTPALPSNLIPGLLYQAVGIYANLLSNITKQNMLTQLGLANVASTSGISDMVSNNINIAKTQGWISAGSLYFILSKGSKQDILTTANQKFISIAPNLQNTKLKKTSIDSLSQVFQTYSNLINNNSNSTVISALFNTPESTVSTGSFHFLNPWSALLIPIDIIFFPVGLIIHGLIVAVEGATEALLNGLTNIDGDPLLEHARLGAILMGTCEGIIITLVTAFLAFSVGFAWTGCMLPTSTTVTTAISMLGVPLMSIAAALWVFGATLGIYTPMIPYMMFTITALSWIMLVIEAIVAAPIVALGLIMPAQEELGALHAALGIIANIFLRPMLMLIGLIMSVKIFNVMIKLVGYGFAKSIGILQDVQMYGSLLSCIPIAALYIGFTIALENKCFSLIYQVPDKILRWIGVSPETTDVAGVMQETKGTYDSGSRKGIEGLKDIGTQASNKMMEDSKNKNSKGGGNDSGGDTTNKTQDTKDANKEIATGFDGPGGATPKGLPPAG